jgi:hypothetical protein
MLDEFITIIKDIAEIEDYYARHLEKVGNDLTKFLEKGTLSYGIAGLKSSYMA